MHSWRAARRAWSTSPSPLSSDSLALNVAQIAQSLPKRVEDPEGKIPRRRGSGARTPIRAGPLRVCCSSAASGAARRPELRVTRQPNATTRTSKRRRSTLSTRDRCCRRVRHNSSAAKIGHWLRVLADAPLRSVAPAG